MNIRKYRGGLYPEVIRWIEAHGNGILLDTGVYAARRGREYDELLKSLKELENGPEPERCYSSMSYGGGGGAGIQGPTQKPYKEHYYEIMQHLEQLGESFSQRLFRLLDERGMSDVMCYRQANISRQVFSDIRSDAGYRPSKATALSLAVALKLDMDQTQELLLRAGLALSPSSTYDLIFSYYISQGIYDLDLINETLGYFGQKLLFPLADTRPFALMGAIIGDVVGSVYEFDNIKTKDFPTLSADCTYTDDTIMTVAVARAMLEYRRNGANFQAALIKEMKRLGRRYPRPEGGYGLRFAQWLFSESKEPYGSYGNGAAMRVSACGLAADSLEEALTLAEQSAAVTHNHPEGIRGAQAVAAAVYLAAEGLLDKKEIGAFIEQRFYSLEGMTLNAIRENYCFHASCQESVPQAIEAFLESKSYEDALHNAVSIGGDSDTIAAITGSIAWAYYLSRAERFPQDMRRLRDKVSALLPDEFLQTVTAFDEIANKELR